MLYSRTDTTKHINVLLAKLLTHLALIKIIEVFALLVKKLRHIRVKLKVSPANYQIKNMSDSCRARTDIFEF
jgi:hypothetical protein